MKANRQYITYIVSGGLLLAVGFLTSFKTGFTDSINFSKVFNYLAPDTLPPDSGKTDSSLILRFPIEDNTSDFISNWQRNSFDLKNPSNIKRNVEYDPSTNEYILTQTIGDNFYREPAAMSFEEYLQAQFKHAEESNFIQRAKASSLLEDPTAEPKTFFVKKEGDIFGGSAIEIKPTGNVDLTFGFNYQNVDNPLFTEQQRRTGGFNFDMNISTNVIGVIGDKLKINFNYNTQATFDFENQMKLEFAGEEDQIIRKIEAGNVSFPLPTSLITGSQSLFGIKTDLQFGRLSVSSVLSQQKSKSESLKIQGGVQTRDFEITADNYEENKHFFLAHYFRDNYNKALSTLPLINSLISITKIEVWVTNKSGSLTNNRDIVAFIELGESATGTPDNSSNNLYDKLKNDVGARNAHTAIKTLTGTKFNLNPVQDFEKTYARLLKPGEYSFSTAQSQLGYISLNQALYPDEVLAVAFQYTYNGKIFQVGEFAQDVPPGEDNSNVLFVKLLKSTSVNPNQPLWNLMMKNIYSLNAYQVGKDQFSLNIYYQDPGGGEKRYIPEGKIIGIPLISVLNLDNLNNQLDPTSDGVFDFIPGITIDVQKGRVIFPVLEPFGEDLEKQFDPIKDKFIAKKYVYNILYDSTKIVAQQFPELNRYLIRGRYRSSVSDEISLGAWNLPPGSVTVTAGGKPLTEGIDYQVDYQLGKVRILNSGVLNSGVPIDVSFEKTELFGIQQKSLFGSRFDYYINDNFTLGGTIMRLSERPYTQKVNYGDEPIANAIYGVDGSYHTESQLLTKLIDRLPLIQTKEISSITVTGEYAHLVPGHPKRAIGKDGTSYLDDFESSQSFYALKLPITNWKLASTPRNSVDRFGNPLFPEANLTDSLPYGFNRARLAWYVVDPVFFRSIAANPDYIKQDKDAQSDHCIREVQEQEIFPNKEREAGLLTTIPILNLSYYPDERGPYNYDVAGVSGISKGIKADGKLNDPASRWAGIMQDIDISDFEVANVEFIEFWLMDPFIDNPTDNGGEVYIHLGNVSEDILKDGRKVFENGLPESVADSNKIDSTNWGRTPKFQPVNNAFSNDPLTRPFQDVGYDGLRNVDERTYFNTKYIEKIKQKFGASSQAYLNALNDPSADDYHYFRGDDYDSALVTIEQRYKQYNNPDGNSPVTQPGESISSSQTTIPDTEDINGDNTLSETEEYFQYSLAISPTGLEVGKNYIVNKQVSNVQLINKDNVEVSWYQFKIPVKEFQYKTGNIQDFKSIRFLRMYLTGFDSKVCLRFARFGLVRNAWRKYQFSLLTPGEYIPNDNAKNTTMNLTVVNIEENAEKSPVNYVIPPGIEREIAPSSFNAQNIQLNEQALSLQVCNLDDGDSRAIYRTVLRDLRSFKRLKMYIHAEEGDPTELLKDDEITAFIRIGSDFTSNYYEYEVSLKVTPPGSYSNNSDDDKFQVWPAANVIDFSVDSLVRIKLQRNSDDTANITQPYVVILPNG
ncbi:MAG: cell surface protein SprA, partial [Bacteroidetes bacterium]|nr:cell surface protein SprA [Bacteroidota bacterium]